MNHDNPVAIPRMLDLDLAGFNNVQIDVCLTGTKDGLTIGVVASGTQRLNHREFCAGKSGKRDLFYFYLSHSALLDAATIRLVRCVSFAAWRKLMRGDWVWARAAKYAVRTSEAT